MAKPPELLDPLPTPARSAKRTPVEPTPAREFGDADGSAPTQDSGADSAPSAPSRSGEQLPYQSWERYSIVSFLGAGAMGLVYKARDPRLNRSVVIKFLRGGQAQAFDTRQRRHFDREARAQAQLDHPHICKIYEVGEVEGQPYIAMQLIHGSSLWGLQQVLSREDKVRALLEVAEALHVAHTQNLIHRDLKPGNIIVERRPDGRWWPYLMDFGLAREVDSDTQTSAGGVEGTPAFMAPEQARGETRRLDARTDLYGLGATLYASLAGRPPFSGNSTEVLVAVLNSDPPRLRTLDPLIPEALETIVHKCLEKEPKRRYASAQELAEDLKRYLDGTRIAARPPGVWRRVGGFARRHKLLVASATTALLASVALGGVALRIRLQAAEQARLAQHLGQEITKMEWLLRSARQMPLHDLQREKVIIRGKMAELAAELAGYGEVSRGLAHYALGRGHMALHEYPQALTQLQQALALGVKNPELHYALGVVLGKHFEQTMYEARLAGGGEWAKKQLKQIEPKYLTPAVEALQRSRAMKLDAPEYLEALIASYQRDYEGALKRADAALRQAPWLYEASKLSGDVHLERALQARDSGREEEAKREFAGAAKAYEAAAAVGQSDGEVFEGLAEVWIRQIQTAVRRSESTEIAYVAAMAAIDKIAAAEPQSIAAPLKKAFAVLLAMPFSGSGLTQMQRVRECLLAAETVLQKQPGHPYASDLAANCSVRAAEGAQEQGEDPEPLLRKAFGLLEPVLQTHPHFLWGINDLGVAQATLGTYLQLHGKPSAREMIQKSVESYAAAAALDPTYSYASHNILDSLRLLIVESRSEEELRSILSRADDWFTRCKSLNSKEQQCFINYFLVYARAAQRTILGGQDPQPRLKRANEHLAETRKRGGSLLDCEQHAVLAQLTEAGDRVRRKQDPAPALLALQADLSRCFAIAPQDPMCRTLAAQAEWVKSDWLASQNQGTPASLEAALANARLATQSPGTYPDAWQTLAETHLRMAYALPKQPRLRNPHLVAGLAAVEKIFSINPNHALGLATQGALQLLRAQAEDDKTAQQTVAQSAVRALQQAIKSDPFLSHSYAPLQKEAERLLPQPL